MLSVIATLAVTSALWSGIAVQLSGDWTLTFDPDFGGRRGTTVDCTFVQNDEALTGTCGSAAPLTGDIKGTVVRFRVKTGPKNEYTASFEGRLDQPASTITGSWNLVDDGGKRDGKFTLKKHER